jgi:catechol 2,3-dioxygenase-like lactoylglutathione lyase family enzyme
MKLKSMNFCLLVENFSVCYHFYRDVLDFIPVFGTDAEEYAEFDTGGGLLALFTRSGMAEAINAQERPANCLMQDRAVMVLTVENVDETVKELEARGVRLAAPLTDRPAWGARTAHFYDPDGNLIEVNHPIPMN